MVTANICPQQNRQANGNGWHYFFCATPDGNTAMHHPHAPALFPISLSLPRCLCHFPYFFVTGSHAHQFNVTEMNSALRNGGMQRDALKNDDIQAARESGNEKKFFVDFRASIFRPPSS